MHTPRSASRAIRRAAAGILLLVALAPAASARAQLLRIIEDPRREPGAEFGFALAASDGAFAVGAPNARVRGSEGAGRVQLFATSGTLLRTFEGSTNVPGARLGTTLLAHAGRLYAGAPGDRPIGVSGIGALHVFDVASGALVRVIGSPDPTASTVPIGGTIPGVPLPTSTGPRPVAQSFGRALAATDDSLVVGAPDSVVKGMSGAGAVYVFDTDGALVRTVHAPTPRADALFGTSVAVIGDTLVVGVPGAPSVGVDRAGIVQVFDMASGALLRTLSAPVSRAGAEFGTVVGARDGMLFVSAPGDAVTGASAAGAVYLFAAAATFDRVLTPPQSKPGLDFGRAVLAFGGDLLIGADGAGSDGSGQAFLVAPNTSALLARLTPTLARAGGRFGFALAGADIVVAIGEPATGESSAAGRVHLFGPSIGTSPADPGSPEPSETLPPTGAAAHCPLAATTQSIDCRLALLLGAVRDERLSRLVGSLRRAGRDVRRAGAVRGPRRTRALERAARGIGDVADRLQSGRGTAALAEGTRAALVATASAVRSDLLILAESGAH